MSSRHDLEFTLRAEQFVQYCETRNLPDHKRVDLALLCEELTYPFVQGNAKDDEMSEHSRRLGNEKFGTKLYQDALQHYNASVALATGNGDTLALAYANRSALLFEKKFYKECLKVGNRLILSSCSVSETFKFTFIFDCTASICCDQG